MPLIASISFVQIDTINGGVSAYLPLRLRAIALALRASFTVSGYRPHASRLDNHLRYRLAPVAVARRGDGASLEHVDRTGSQIGDRDRRLRVRNRLAAPSGGIGGTRSDTRPAEFIAGCALSGLHSQPLMQIPGPGRT